MDPQSIAHYRVTGKLGEGGMGAVYRATDTKLGRDVAIKVLPDAFANDADRLSRFTREAQVLASLNHPNIAAIYGIEDRAIVMELVEGPTLADRVAQGPLPIDEAVRIARQIAEALKVAHEKGIVHRDLKPANVKITSDGVVKVLDFGLAKLSGAKEAADASTAPTQAHSPTVAGMILGTAGYMSPEQAAGQAVDRRADIWAFGVVSWEMLSGVVLFQRETANHTLAEVMRAPIDFNRLPPSTPRRLRTLIARCLDRNLKKRLQDIGEASYVLEEYLAKPEDDVPAVPMPGPGPAASRWLWVGWSVTALVLAALAMVHFREKAPNAVLMRFQIPGPEKATLGPLSLSPDGRRLAFVVRAAGVPPRIWVRSLDTLESRPLPGTDGVDNPPFWSPDSRFIGFGIPGKLKKVEASGGPPQTVCDLPGAMMMGGAWAPDGTILFGVLSQPMMQIPDAGGKPTALAALGVAPGNAVFPTFLPDGRHFIFVRGTQRQSAIYLGSLDAKPEQQNAKPLATGSRGAPVYAPSPDPGLGYVLFEREGSLVALPFDVRRFEPAGEAVHIAEKISSSGAPFSASSTGLLAFHADASGDTESRLLWFDRQGKQLGQIGPAAPYSNVQLSRDGKLLVVEQTVKHVSHLWSADPARGVFSRMNPGDIGEYAGQAISADGRVAFTYESGGAPGDIYVRLASGAGTPELLVKSATMKHPIDWSADGRFLIYEDHTAQKVDLWIVPMSGVSAAERKPIPFLVTPANETDAIFSPDTRWIAYSSDESGRYEVYVQGFAPGNVPAAGIGRWQISTAGGAKPYWRRDGKELYYLAGRKMMAVTVRSTATAFAPGVAVPLFDTRPTGYAPYVVAPDGRFLINTLQEAAANTSPITLVLNWTAGLKK